MMTTPTLMEMIRDRLNRYIAPIKKVPIAVSIIIRAMEIALLLWL